MHSSQISFQNKSALNVSALLDGEGTRGVVLCNHFLGFKEERIMHNLARGFADAGMQALRFDNTNDIGKSGGALENITVTSHIEDAVSALDFLESKGVTLLGIAGHSLGGLVSVAVAAQDARVKAVSPIAAPPKNAFEFLGDGKVAQWRAEGHLDFALEKEWVQVPVAFLDDFEKYDVTELVKTVKVPVLTIAAENDELIDVQAAESINTNANEPKKLEVIPGADHMFSQKEQEQQLIKAAVEWFKEYL